MRFLILLCLAAFVFASCSFPSRKMSKNLAILQPHFASLHHAILNEDVDSNVQAVRKMRIPYYSSDTAIRRLLTKARVHSYEVIPNSNRIVRLGWLGEKYSYYLFLGISNREVTKETSCETRCKTFRLNDSVLLQRHYTPLVVTY